MVKEKWSYHKMGKKQHIHLTSQYIEFGQVTTQIQALMLLVWATKRLVKQ